MRELTPHFTSDRYWADDMAALQAAVLGGTFGTMALDAVVGGGRLRVTGFDRGIEQRGHACAAQDHPAQSGKSERVREPAPHRPSLRSARAVAQR